jgi:hypothetical protein
MNRYCQVTTRRFGKSGEDLPSSCMVPMCDMFNHNGDDVQWGLMDKKLHLEGDVNSNYYEMDRSMNDYSALFGGEEGVGEAGIENVKGHFDRDSYEKH